MFDFLKRSGQCDSCLGNFPKSQLNALDSTLDAQRAKGGEVLWLCRTCLLARLPSYFKAYHHRAIVVYPLGTKWNSYQFWTFDRMLRLYNFEKSWVDDIKRFLPAATATCIKCGQRAQFNWCDPKVYFGEPFPDKVNIAGNFKQELMCGECLAREFGERITSGDLRFDSIWPPLDADGFCTSWEQ